MLITAPLPLDTIEGSTALVTFNIELMLQSTRAWHRASPFSTYRQQRRMRTSKFESDQPVGSTRDIHNSYQRCSPGHQH